MTRRELRAQRPSMARALFTALVFCSVGSADCSSSSAPAGSQPGANDDDGGNSTSAGDGGGAATQIPIVSAYDVAKTYAGEYAAKIQFGKIESAGPLGSMTATVTILGTATITDNGASQGLSFDLRFCHSTLAGTGTGFLMGAGLVTPDVVLTTTTLQTVGFAAAKSGDTVEWQVPLVSGPIGWHWSGPGDTLPTSPSDSRIFDQDGDGNPGVTIEVSEGSATSRCTWSSSSATRSRAPSTATAT